MIVTVTMNPAIDKSISVPGFAIGRTNRARTEKVDLGGKGINVARALHKLGCPATALGFLPGNEGPSMSAVLAATGIHPDFLYVPGEIRTNLKIKDPLTGSETEINQLGFQVDAGHLEDLAVRVREHASRSAAVILSGSLPEGAPPDIYARLLRIAKSCGARTVLDASGAAFKHGLAERPDLVKPNRAEVEELLAVRIEGDPQLLDAARSLLGLGVSTVVISLGADGALAASAGRAWRARPLPVKTASTVGSGDAMVAALALAMIREVPLPDALRMATAAGSASATLEGSEVADLDAVNEFLPKVTIESMDLPERASS